VYKRDIIEEKRIIFEMYIFLVFVNLSVSAGNQNASKFCYISFADNAIFITLTPPDRIMLFSVKERSGGKKYTSSHLIGKICGEKFAVAMTIFGMRETLHI
jgi:hypothetical protein